ncbi:hypothetical protein HGRIS_013851 [Hohenbuehelia grisea]|uniref:DUF6593 domain-containing protein n=1 Tax=Hohenbuehelia grisea TaxID=104357 RepID=A0ABR3IX33_9AGAR
MQFTLSNSVPLNTVFTDEDGQPTYKVQTPFKLFGDKKTTISRVAHTHSISSGDGKKAQKDDERYIQIAEIDWKADVSQSTFKYREKEMAIGDYFNKYKQGWRGKDRIFNGPDGQDYRWRISASNAELTAQDPSRTPIARYEPEQPNLVSKTKKATLEIYPEGEHMVDTIVVSFVYMEKIRKDREHDARMGVGDPVRGIENE